MSTFRTFSLLSAGVLAGLAPSPAALAQDGFYGTSGGQITDPSGAPVVLRGVGLGGWLVPEGYMLHISAPDGGSPTSIRNQVEDLIGPDDADTFFELYRANYVEEKDIAQIAAWGYDHVRLPFHYKDFFDPETEQILESGFTLLDTFLDWCRTYEIDVILDMHAAPGGQNDGNISDSDGEARLWTEPIPYQDWTVEIWTEIATRYADETLIIGYDLINEPVVPESVPASDLRALYVRLTDAVRAVDPNHILFIEGNYYATDFGALVPAFDDNMVWAFHKYWNAPDTGSIAYLLTLRDETDTPLWLGETGENSNAWFFATRQLAERNGIGWNWWTHKKIDSRNSPASAPFAPGYQAVVDYWRGAGPRPSQTAARDALFAMAVGLDLDRTATNDDVLAALFDDSFGTTPRPYAAHTIPGSVHAAQYDSGDQSVAYSDRDPWADSGSPGSGNTGGAYRNDGVDIERSTDPQGFAYNVGWTEGLEWLRYSVTVEQDGLYDAEFRVASGASGGRLTLAVDGETLGAAMAPGTGGWQSWQSVWLRGVPLHAGERLLQLNIRTGGFNLNTMRFVRVSGLAAEPDAAQTTALLSVAPNPVADRLAVRYRTAVPAQMSLEVFDALGRRVLERPAETRPAGNQHVDLDLALPPGAYVLRLMLENGAETHHFRRVLTVAQ